MALSLRSPSTSQYLSVPSHVWSFSSEESKLRAVPSTCHTHLKVVLLGISFTESNADSRRRNNRVSTSGIAVAQQWYNAEQFASKRRSPYSREKCTLGANSTGCRACGETSGGTSVASSSGVSGMENGAAARGVTRAYEQNGTTVEKKVAIVWFKHDLRMDDHVGLASAIEYEHVLPVFIFDSWFYAGWSEERLSNLFDAVADLRRSLKSIGSTLVVRKGRSKDVLLALAEEVGATEIIAEEETEQMWYDLVGSVSASLSVKSLSGQKTGVKHWRAPLYDLEGLKDVPVNYKEFRRLRRRVLGPVDAPSSLPALPANAEPGKLPSLVDFIGSCKAKCKENPFGEVLMVAQSKPAESLVMGKPHMTNGNSRQGMKAGDGVARKWSDLLNKRAGGMPFNFVWERRRHRHVKAEKRSEVGVITGGASGAMNMLHVYMKALESTHSPHGGMYEHIQELEKRPGSSFRAIFNSALELGSLSRRRVYYEVMKYERERGGGHVSPFGLSTFTASAAVEDVKSIEVISVR